MEKAKEIWKGRSKQKKIFAVAAAVIIIIAIVNSIF